jgi:hypothetical protein
VAASLDRGDRVDRLAAFTARQTDDITDLIARHAAGVGVLMKLLGERVSRLEAEVEALKTRGLH